MPGCGLLVMTRPFIHLQGRQLFHSTPSRASVRCGHRPPPSPPLPRAGHLSVIRDRHPLLDIPIGPTPRPTLPAPSSFSSSPPSSSSPPPRLLWHSSFPLPSPLLYFPSFSSPPIPLFLLPSTSSPLPLSLLLFTPCLPPSCSSTCLPLPPPTRSPMAIGLMGETKESSSHYTPDW